MSKAPPSLATLQRRHEAAVNAFAAKASRPFHARAKWLLAQIKRELPMVTGIAYCNGDHWLEPANAPVTFRGGLHEDETTDTLRNVMDIDWGHTSWLPDVSPRCLEHLKELNELCMLSAYCRDHTLEAVSLPD